MTTVKVNLSELKTLVENGKKVEDLMQNYGLTKSATRAMLKQAGLKIKKQQAPKFQLINDDSTSLND